MKLYYSRNPNPRLAVAVALHLNSVVELEFASPLSPDQREFFRPLNPNLRLPILVNGDDVIWEADAIACCLSRHVGSNFWRNDSNQPDMIRWISWGKEHFVRACDIVNWERATKLRYQLGICDEAVVEDGLAQFREASSILNAHLAERQWLLGDEISYADFRMATFLPFNDVARLPLQEFPELTRWSTQLDAFKSWADPFDGLDAPALPSIPPAGDTFSHR